MELVLIDKVGIKSHKFSSDEQNRTHTFLWNNEKNKLLEKAAAVADCCKRNFCTKLWKKNMNLHGEKLKEFIWKKF